MRSAFDRTSLPLPSAPRDFREASALHIVAPDCESLAPPRHSISYARIALHSTYLLAIPLAVNHIQVRSGVEVYPKS